MGASLHLTAIMIALKIKRAYARQRAQGFDQQRPENLISGLGCYCLLAGLQVMFVLMSGVQLTSAFLWSILPSLTGYYAAKYIDRASAGKRASNLRVAKQTSLMFLTAVIICLIYLLPSVNLQETPPLIWYFTAYAGVTASLIGWAVGYFFQRLYTHRERSDHYNHVARDRARSDGRCVVGDLIVEQVRSTGKHLPQVA
jgi:uncharacterized BrkB/YihY/UPF0761 family membrane protein